MPNFTESRSLCRACRQKLINDEAFDCSERIADVWYCQGCRDNGDVTITTDGQVITDVCFCNPALKPTKEEKKAWEALKFVYGEDARSSDGGHLAAALSHSAETSNLPSAEAKITDQNRTLWICLKLTKGTSMTENGRRDPSLSTNFARQSGDWSMNVNRPPTPPESPAAGPASLPSAKVTHGPRKSPLQESHSPSEDPAPTKPSSPEADPKVDQPGTKTDSDDHKGISIFSAAPKKRRRLHRGTVQRSPTPEPAASPVVEQTCSDERLPPKVFHESSFQTNEQLFQKFTDSADQRCESKFPSIRAISPKTQTSPPREIASIVISDDESFAPTKPISDSKSRSASLQHVSTAPIVSEPAIPAPSSPPPIRFSPAPAVSPGSQSPTKIVTPPPIDANPAPKRKFDPDFFVKDMLKSRSQSESAPPPTALSPKQQSGGGFTPINGPGGHAYPFLKQKRDLERRNSAQETPRNQFTIPIRPGSSGAGRRRKAALALPEGMAPPPKRRASMGIAPVTSDSGVSPTTSTHPKAKRPSSRLPTAQYPLRKPLPPGYVSPHEFPASARNKFPLTEEFYAHDYIWKVKQHVREAELQIAVCPTPKMGVRLMITGLGAISSPQQFVSDIARLCNLDGREISKLWFRHLWMADEQEGKEFSADPEQAAEAYGRTSREVAELFREKGEQCLAAVYLRVVLKEEPMARQNPGGLVP